MERYRYIVKDADGNVVERCDHSKNYNNAVRPGYTKEVIESAEEFAKIEIYKAPVFDAQTCEGDLFTNFLPTISADDQAILAKNQSVSIILKCFSYNNDKAWGTLMAHMASLASQGLSNKTLSGFKKIMKDNHKDLDAYSGMGV